MLSFAENIPMILKVIGFIDPKNVLDVGSGLGKYGLLIRENNLSSRAEAGDLSPKDTINISCCEPNPYFFERADHHFIYDEHWHQDISDVPIDVINRKDLVMFIDVVEHHPKHFIHNLLETIKVPVLISTPKHTVFYTEEYYGDKHVHVSQWDEDDFVGWEDYSTELSYIKLRR